MSIDLVQERKFVERDAARILGVSGVDPWGEARDMATRKECQKYLFSKGTWMVDRALAYCEEGRPGAGLLRRKRRQPNRTNSLAAEASPG